MSAQMRAARAMLRLSALDLARLSKVGVATIRRVEVIDSRPPTKLPFGRRLKLPESSSLMKTGQVKASAFEGRRERPGNNLRIAAALHAAICETNPIWVGVRLAEAAHRGSAHRGPADPYRDPHTGDAGTWQTFTSGRAYSGPVSSGPICSEPVDNGPNMQRARIGRDRIQRARI